MHIIPVYYTKWQQDFVSMGAYKLIGWRFCIQW